MRNAFFACARYGNPTTIDIAAVVSDWPDNVISWVLHDWEVWARDDQLPPPDVTENGRHWRAWLLLGGRGAGKTRAGAEWIRAQALGRMPFADEPCSRIALIGETMHDVRSVMVEGESGLLTVHPPHERPRYEPSKAQLIWPNGTIAQLFSAESPDSLRGPQFAAAWCDEIAKWRHAEEVWDMLQFALRLGTAPRVVATTTPRPVPILKKLMQADTTVTTHSRTSDNRANLAPAYLAEMRRRYAGTQLGRQELDGELIETLAGSLWRLDWICDGRTQIAPALQRIVVAVDPPVTSTISSDACGIVVAGVGEDGRCYVLADRTIQGRAPSIWARSVIDAFADFEADRIVAEVNQGGDLVTTVLRQFDANVPITSVRATRGKWIRAEPVAALYAEGRVAHVGEFAELEAQMLAFGADGRVGGRSPDRVDALVWAVTDLMLSRGQSPSARFVYAGARANPIIADFFRDAGHPEFDRDEIPWCAAFVGACLERADHRATGSLLARSYLDWGEALDQASLGAVAVFSRGRDPDAGHVGFVIGESDDTIILLGGNQGNSVSVARFSKDRLLGLRWPEKSDGQGVVAANVLFEQALAHVLEMEGGFTNDPYDPGGPTNRGITLETYAKHLGQRLGGDTDRNLLRKLKAIDSQTIRSIYDSRYWQPSHAGDLPATLALMHFDAAVNHGVHGAARMLQQAVRVTVDGEIGPITLGAARSKDPHRTSEIYADIRRNRYRSLHHFWRFGRGWLNRVDKTLQRSRTIQQALPHSNTQRPSTQGDREMTTNLEPQSDRKWWGTSMTIWGTMITALSTVLPLFAPAIGLDITPELVKAIGDQLVTVAQAVGGLIGTAMTVYGRSRATSPLSRRQVQVSL